MVEVLNQMVKELLNENLSTQELESLAREVSNHEALVEALRDHIELDFRPVTVS